MNLPKNNGDLRGLLMPFESSRRSAMPYRFGVTLICCGALVNWLGLGDMPPVRYIGISCLAVGAMLIIVAIICWAQQQSLQCNEDEENAIGNNQNVQGNDVHVININESTPQKPPDYATLTETPPPSYDAAIALNPALLLYTSHRDLCQK